MSAQNEVTIQVKRGTKVKVEEVDRIEGDRSLVAVAPKSLKLAIKRVEGTNPSSASMITMCG